MKKVIGLTVIGEGVSVRGRLKVPGKVTLNGTLEGELVADELTIGPRGALFGRVQARRVDVYGQAHESISASEYLMVRSGGQIHGIATYGDIEVEVGGRISGKFNRIEKRAQPSGIEEYSDSSLGESDPALDSPPATAEA